MHPRCSDKFASKHKIDIFDNSIANLNTWEFVDHEHLRIFSSTTSRVFISYIHILKLPWNSDNSSNQNIHEQNYIDSARLSQSCLSEDQCFPFSSLNWVNNWCCYKSIWKNCYTIQIICLLSLLKQTIYEANYFWGD